MLDGLKTGLDGNAGIADGITVTASHDNADDLSLDVHFNNTLNTFVPLDAMFGADLNVTGGLSVNTTLDFQVTLGAYWDAGSNSPVFYINGTNDQLTISSTVSAANLR